MVRSYRRVKSASLFSRRPVPACSEESWSTISKLVLCKVDGERIDMEPEKRSVSMLPGKHRVLFMYQGKGPLVAVEWSFNVDPGHKYLIAFPDEQPDSGVMMWLENLTTGKRVTEITSSPFKSPYACF